jgi:hypothetical protein
MVSTKQIHVKNLVKAFKRMRLQLQKTMQLNREIRDFFDWPCSSVAVSDQFWRLSP